MKDPGRRHFSAKRKANFRPRTVGTPGMVIGQPTGTPPPSQHGEPLLDEAPPTEVADQTTAAEPPPEVASPEDPFAHASEAPAGDHPALGEEARYPEDFSPQPAYDRTGEVQATHFSAGPTVEHSGTVSGESRDPVGTHDPDHPAAPGREPASDFEARESAEFAGHGDAAEPGEFSPAAADLAHRESRKHESVSPAPEHTAPDETSPPDAYREAQPDHGFAAPPTEYSSRRGARTQPPRFPIPPPPFYRSDPSPQPSEPEPPVPADPAAETVAEMPPPPAPPEPAVDESSRALEAISPKATSEPAPPAVPPGAAPTSEQPKDESLATLAEPLPAALSEPSTAPAGAPAPLTPSVPPPAAMPAAFLPRHSPDYAPNARRGASFATVALWSLVFLALGAAAGYFGPDLLKLRAATQLSPESAPKETSLALSPAEQNDVDAAFTAAKALKFSDAMRLFTALQSKHPAWGSMAIEIGRTQLYEHDMAASRATLEAAESKGQQPADANFMLALLYMTDNSYAEAETHFARATALDPARPDFYYFWGECLRREGKPLDAINKFRSALIRNQYETSEGLYRLKLWLSEIQADQENASGASAEIEAFLAQPRPPMEALFGGAARAIKAGQIATAADLIRRARQWVEPSVYAVIMRDPTFAQENWRPEFAEFFKTAAAPANGPAASPAVVSPLAPVPPAPAKPK